MSKFIIFTGPSGVGKATIEERLFNDPTLGLEFSISATTREPRDGEIDGTAYHFLSREIFDQKIKNDEFIEWNEHFGNKYGTPKSEVKRITDSGNIPFMEVETVGAQNIMKQMNKEDYVSIFLSPPSIGELRKRIIGRSTETEEQIELRLKRVEEEMAITHLFDYVVVNDEIESTAEKISEIIRGING